ncbi:restriction endonuclease subunit S [Rheinheimera gaetbuli]
MAVQVEQLITEHLDLWTQAQTAKSSSGRGSNNKIELTGIKKLRELILELAVRGKLVPQDPNDEPASELLKCIAAEKEALIKAKVIRKSKELAPVGINEIPYDIPNGWVLTRLGSIGDWGAGATPSRARSEYYGGDIPWFKSGELTADFIDFSEEKITSIALQDCSLRLNKIGDVLIAMYGATIGKASILSVEGTTNQAVCACTPFCGITNVYLLTLLKAYKHRFVSMGAGGAQPNISREKIIATPILLPPLAEQSKIVEKVDELMALCDQLEQQSYQQLDAHNQLVDALLATLTQSQNADELATNWQRLAAHFDMLFTTEYSIDALKQTILQLAVMGKLVKQDPNEEPASELLKRIAAEKDALVKAGKIKKQKPLPPISDEDKPFELPEGWEWCRLQEVIDVRDGTHDSPKDAFGENVYPLVTSKDFNDGKINFDTARTISEEDHIEISKRSLVEVEDILFSMIGGNIGNQVMVSDPRPFSIKNVALFKYFDKKSTLPEFVFLFTKHLAKTLQSEASGGAQPFVSLGKLRGLVFALPPIAEQSLIVQKFNELENICSFLSHRINLARQTQATLAEALVEQVLA